MNIIEAANAASRGERIYNEERGEWIEFSSGSLRYTSNRAEVKFSMKDLISDAWLSENDFIVTHRAKIHAALDHISIGAYKEDTKESFISAIRIDVEKEKAILVRSGAVPNEA